MKLKSEFYKLPLHFDVEKLQAEVAQFTENDWQPHPQNFAGNSALLLVAVDGDPTNDALKGAMEPTPHLKKCPYLQQVLASFQTVIGRTRLMRLDSSAQVSAHTDAHYYWQQRVRVHVPIQTYPEVEFICGDRRVNMAAGETWIFDTSKMHNVINPTPNTRIHLVSDTVGTADFWNLVEKAKNTEELEENKETFQGDFIGFNPAQKSNLITENVNAPIVMSPWEQKHLVNLFWESFWEMDNSDLADVDHLEKTINNFQNEWMGLWSQYGTSKVGISAYQAALNKLEHQLKQFKGSNLKLHNGIGILSTLKQLLILPALNFDIATQTLDAIEQTSQAKSVFTFAQSLDALTQETQSIAGGDRHFDRPIFIIAAPRSGSTFLFETLRRSPSLLTIGDESHGVFESIPDLKPANRNYASNELTEADVTPEIAAQIKQNFLEKLEDFRGEKLKTPPSRFRFLEKTPKNALRIPFLQAIFPDARFIYLYREPKNNISSIIEAWKSGRFVTYRDLPGWIGKPWSLLLIPEWQRLKKKSVPKIATTQWETTHNIILKDLKNIPKNRLCGVNYDDLVQNPQREIQRLCDFAEIDWEVDLNQEQLPLSKFTVTPPDPNKWKKNAAALKTFLPKVQPTANKVSQFIKSISEVSSKSTAIASNIATPAEKMTSPKTGNSAVPEEKTHEPPAVVSCSDSSIFAELLRQLNCSVVITAPSDDQIISLCSVDGHLHSHSRNFAKPGAFWADRARLDLVTQYQLSHFRNMAAVAKKLEPQGTYDACYLHRKGHVIGELFVEDLGYAQGQVWGVSSRFSCLFTIDAPYSFVPRWKPAFLKTLAPNDACHLNGLAIADDVPKYVTALSATSTPQGWRQTALDQGVLIDVDSNEIIAGNLKSPTAPRWYQDKLWLLESTTGRFSVVDLNSGNLEQITQIPGFSRSLTFMGDYAFIAVDNLPTEFEGQAGVWIVEIKTGNIAAHSIFQDIERCHGIQVLPKTMRPDITNFEEVLIGSSYALSQAALKEVAMAKYK